MPWCDACDRFLSPSTVTADGACPRCGRIVDPGRAHPPDREAPPTVRPTAPVPAAQASENADDERLPPIPWHLKMLAGAVALYLGWRAYQGIEWLVRHL